AVFVTACVLALPGAADADGPYEPNQDIAESAGPIAGDSPISGAIETDNDEDWYRVNLHGGRQVSFVIDSSDGFDDCRPALYDTTGDSISDRFGWYDTDRFSYTTPYGGDSQYFFVMNGSAGCNY